MSTRIRREDFRFEKTVQKEDALFEIPGFWERFFGNLINNKLALVCCILLVIIIGGAVFAFLSPYDPDRYELADKFQGPSLAHLCGTDDLGRDYFTRALYGGRVSLTVGVLSMAVSVLIGTAVGTLSGYIGGKLDFLLMRIVDIMLSLPALLVIIVISAYITPSMFSVVCLISVFAWMSVARVVRAETMTLKERDFVLAAQLQGIPALKIIMIHIVPNLASTIIVAANLSISNAILTESALSFLGFGVPLPKASWGSMLRTAQAMVLDSPLLAVIPGVLIIAAVFGFNVLGEVIQVTMHGESLTKGRKIK